MAQVNYTIISGDDYSLKLGVDMNTSGETATSINYAPIVSRYDKNPTQNSGGWYKEQLYVDSTKIGEWNMSMPSDEDWEWRDLDTFQIRTLAKTHSAQTLKLRIYWYDFATKDPRSAGYNWHYASDSYHDWTVNIPAETHYTVTYNKNCSDSVSNMPSNGTKWYSSTYYVSSNTPTRTGYTFAGWNTKADGTGTNYAKGATYTTNAAITLYAKWTLNTWTIYYNGNGNTGGTVPSSQTKKYNVALTLASSGPTKTYYTLDGWATSSTGSVAYNLGASYTKNAGATLYAHWKINAPSAPTGVSASRNSDSKATVSWTRGDGASTTYSRIYVERSTDGGSWTSLGYVAGTATSYSDTTIAANHYYRYRVRAYNSTGYSSYGTSGYIYTTPAAPASVDGERSGDGTSVVLTVGNAGTRNATGFDVQYRAADSDTWADATVASSTGTPVTSITIANMGGSYYFRVRNTRSTLASAWTESALVVTITPPNAPTLDSPVSGSIRRALDDEQPVLFSWTHNPVDGSAQTAAQLAYHDDTTETFTVITVTTNESQSVTLAEGYTYTWKVRTKGADEDYGPWSNTQSFSLYYPPSINVSLSPTDGSGNINGMPIVATISYYDYYGVFASGTLTVKLINQELYSEELPITETTMGEVSYIVGEITTDEFLPSSGNSYIVYADVRSSDTLTSTAWASMPVQMGEPNHGTLEIVNDPETGYASLTVGWDEDTGAVPAIYASLYRVTSEGRLLLADNIEEQDTGFTDRYAPLNTPYHYEVVTHAASTAVASVEFSNEIETQRWFVYWGNNYAWAEWNPSGSYKYSRPEKTRVHYVGREYPVSYDGTALDEEHEITFTVLEMHEWSNGFIQLMHDGGRGVYKSVDGKVFRADFELENVPNYTSITRIGAISLTITRIDGDPL